MNFQSNSRILSRRCDNQVQRIRMYRLRKDAYIQERIDIQYGSSHFYKQIIIKLLVLICILMLYLLSSK